MKYALFKNNEIVGECVVLSRDLVYYHLFKTLRITRECDEITIRKKYKLLTQ